MLRTDRTGTRRPRHALAIPLVVLTLLAAGTSGAGRKFYDDDPLAREPETQDASAVKPWDISLTADLTTQSLLGSGRAGWPPRAGNVNTIDEVPDSSWFTNRIGTRPVTMDEIRRGPGDDRGPGAWHVDGRRVQARRRDAGLHHP